MEFIEELKQVGKMPWADEVNEWIEINEELSLSIQASRLHYCTPQKDLELEDYETMEIAFMDGKSFTPFWGLAKNNPELRDELEQYTQDQEVYSYVPVELVERVYRFLKGEF